jgi:hypothetical protein
VGASIPPASERLARFLDAWARVRPVALQVQNEGLPSLPSRELVEGPSLSLRLGAGMGSGIPGAAPGLTLWADTAIRKDSGHALDAEPVLYFAHLRGALTKSLDTSSLPYLDASLSPVGVRASDWLNATEAEALVLQLARREPQDEQWVIRVGALHGMLRATPGWWKSPGEHGLFMELSAQLLGYKHLRHRSDRPILHALHLLEGGLRLGTRVEPERGAVLTLDAHALADLNFAWPTGATVVQSDIELGGGGALLFRAQGIEPFFHAGWLANRETGPDAILLSALRLRGGVMLTLF